MGCQLALVWQNINSFYVSLIPSADVTPSNRYLYSKMQECCQHAHPKDKEKEKNYFYFFLSLTIYIHLLYLFAFCICKKTNGHKSSKHFRSLDSSSLSKKHTGSVYWSKLKHAAKMSSDEKNKESCIVLIVTLSGIIQREEVQGQHTEKLQTTSLQSTLKRCTSFKIHYSPITNVKSIYSCSMLVQKAYNTAWRAFFFLFYNMLLIIVRKDGLKTPR